MSVSFASAPPQAKRIRVNGIQLNVQDLGQGPAVLLIHGFPDDHHVWRHQVAALVQAGFRVIAADNRGCGDSDVPSRVRDYHVDDLVADLVSVLDALDVRKVKVVGHDWGALIGWYLCMQHPDRVDRYVAMSVGHPCAYARASLAQKLKAWYTVFFQMRGLAEWAIRWSDWKMLRAFSAYPPEANRWVAQLSRPGRLTAGLNFYRANVAMVWPRRLPKVLVPVLGVFSTGDRFLTEAQMRDSHRFVSGPWLYHRIAGASHWMQLDVPQEVNALLISYLRAG